MRQQPIKREPIRPNETILLADFLQRTNLGERAWRTVRQRCSQIGIEIVKYVGRQGYVHTDAWLAYLGSEGTSERADR